MADMETVVPWLRLEEMIELFYPEKGSGRPPGAQTIVDVLGKVHP